MSRISLRVAIGLSALAWGLGLAEGRTASASMLTFHYVHIGSGKTPDGTLTAVVRDVAPDTVEVTMSSDLPASGFVSSWAFNLDPTFTDYAHLSHDRGSVTGGATLADTIKFGPANSVSITGKSIAGFDLGFVWKGSNHGFDKVSSVTYLLSYSGHQAFDARSFSTLNSSGTWYGAAKIQGIAPSGQSGELGAVAAPSVLVPEPNSLALLGLGGTGLIGLWFRRRLRAAGGAALIT